MSWPTATREYRARKKCRELTVNSRNGNATASGAAGIVYASNSSEEILSSVDRSPPEENVSKLLYFLRQALPLSNPPDLVLTRTSSTSNSQVSCGSDLTERAAGKCSRISLIALAPMLSLFSAFEASSGVERESSARTILWVFVTPEEQ
jgi:hypothetical protein